MQQISQLEDHLAGPHFLIHFAHSATGQQILGGSAVGNTVEPWFNKIQGTG